MPGKTRFTEQRVDGLNVRIGKLACGMLALAAGACIGVPDATPVNGPMLTSSRIEVDDEWTRGFGVDGDVVMLSLSGGGARASAFSLGVLQELRDSPARGGGRLIDEVALVTAVSGGAVTAAWFGLNGPENLDEFRPAMLDKNWGNELHQSLLAPRNLARAWQGGINDRSDLAGWLDREVYKGATMVAMRGGPRIILNGTELFTGAPFAFTQMYFDTVCSDASGVLVADAVATSMAVPIFFRPSVIESFNEDCAAAEPAWVDRILKDRTRPILARETARAVRAWRDPSRVGYLHIVDGGVIDNFGVASLIVMDEAADGELGPFSPEDAVRMRSLAFVVVNAEKPDSVDWPLQARGPSGPESLGAILDLSIDASKRMALDAFAGRLADWQRSVISYRCALSQAEAKALGAAEGWDCSAFEATLDVISFHDLGEVEGADLGDFATAVSLPEDQIGALIAGGRRAVRENSVLQAMTR